MARFGSGIVFGGCGDGARAHTRQNDAKLTNRAITHADDVNYVHGKPSKQ